MVTEVNSLIQQCRDELEDRQYRKAYVRELEQHWQEISQWMDDNSIEYFSETVANQYCDLHIGTHLIVEGMGLKAKNHLRAIRMLVSYQRNGDVSLAYSLFC